MVDGREVDPGELLGVAKDEERARSLLRALRTLSAGNDPKLREMADGVLRGRLTAEQAFTDPEYTAALFAGAEKVRREGERRSDAEAREAGESFGEWQRERDAEDERDDQDTASAGAESRTASERSAGPWGRSGPGGLGGSRPTGPLGHR
ncbi:hypothetical protein ACI2L1_37140 [Streptomyces sp. NPDC019531]|uniref:hypothetical protein n=1 Tax=Streptomyces sp. NPDC019531 TaxID=3365062 RepID=UPI00384B6F4A